ncbi:DUF6266 family protein [Pedobacter sp. SYSU D00535]|uniref:DUF6266 family protein n=1 Tax=Pedobacter sp. SYSU D00535 TaxID=2810308 RepID=UPI001A96604D|nr:DUF6266 family protein [Pedobacter sp. SYSU D00535]
MARYSKGVYGPITGKIGNVIGSSWRGIPYFRSRPRKSTKPVTEKQQGTRTSFTFMQNWLSPLHKLLMIGFESYAPPATGRQSAHSYNAKNALIQTEGGYEIDFSKFLLSWGDLPGTGQLDISMKDSTTLLITWDTSIQGEAEGGDAVLYMVHFPDPGLFMTGIGLQCRQDGRAEVSLAEALVNRPGFRIEAFVAFKSLKTNKVSTSQYAGGLTLNEMQAELPGTAGAEGPAYCEPQSVPSGLFSKFVLAPVLPSSS